MAPNNLEKETSGEAEASKVYRTSNYPSPNYKHKEGQRTMPLWDMEEDIVISGISGKFSEADSMDELKYNLMNGVDVIKKDDKRYPAGIFGLPERTGKLKDISKFDNTFFGISPKMTNSMDSGARILLEVVYEAIVDAGINPHSLRGKNVGVYLGLTNSDTEEALTQEPEKNSGYLMLGCIRCLFANRVSYTFDFNGPSIMMDTACSSSIVALNQAILALRTSQCDSAVVAGLNLNLSPMAQTSFTKMNMLSQDGKCRVFDAEASGYAKTEAISAIYLQKAKDAKRIYATVVHCKTNTDGYKEQGITYPKRATQLELLKSLYEEAGIDPADIEYMETHGTGTKAGDYEETNGIADFFCKDRKGPLLIGSVKSNIGHAEAAAGMCSLSKTVIAMESGIIPANLHFNTPNPRIPGLTDGRLKVVSENTPYKGGLVGINNFGMGGVNAHVILKPNPVVKATPPPDYKGEKLFNISGRTEESVKKMLNYIEEHPDEHSVYALLAKPALSPISGHPYRGYTIFNGENPIREIRQCEPHEKPIWYVYPGMGSQWTGMGRDLMEIEIFRDTVHRVHGYLKPYNIDMLKLIMEGNETTYDEILNSFVVIACIQVALTNILKAVGIEPDGIVGHSVGELGCAYADGCFSEEEMIMSAYWRGYQVKTSTLPPGAMAAVGMSWEEVEQRCPKGVVPACHNSEDSVTISGEATVVNKFVKELKAEGKFAKEVNSSNFAFHCYYMQDIAPGLLKVLEKTIPNPKPRTSRWKSSSIPEHRWGIELAQTSSAAYFVNNLVSPVLFHAAVGHIPKDAIIIEIAPHTLLQSVLKRTVGPDATFYGLMKRNQPDSINYLLSSLGKMYINGMNPEVTNLFPAASFPVPRGTPMISPLVEWDHSQSWLIATADKFIRRIPKSGTDIDISSPDKSDYYIVGHTIDGRVLYPATGYLVLAWKELARIKGKDYLKMPVVIEDVSLYRATILPSTGVMSLDVTVTPNDGKFEIVEGDVTVVSGRIYEPAEPELKYTNVVNVPEKSSSEYLPMKTKDVYKAMRLLGYEYGPTFQGILEADNEGTRGKLKWNGNWVSYLDTILQFSFIGNANRYLRLPTRLDYLRINPQEHEKAIISSGEDAHVPVVMDSTVNICISGGVELREMKANVAPRRPLQQSPPILEEHHFVPLVEKTCLNVRDGNEQLIRSYADLCTDYIIQKTKELATRASTIIPNKKLLADIVKRPANFIDADRAVESFLSRTTLNASLLRVLQEIFSIAKDDNFQLNDVIQQRTPELQNDSLLAALLDPRVIRTCLDLVQENIPQGKLKIVEANAVSGNLFSTLVPILMSQPLAQVESVATDVNPGQLSTADLERLDVKSATWDYANEDAPKAASGAHLVFANRALASNIDNVNNCLRSLTGALKDGGFLLLLERTEDCMAAQFLDAIGDVLLPEVRREDLLKAFQAEGLELISEKGDGILSSVFLLRKVPNSSGNVSVIAVEENQYEKWLEKVKLQLDNVQKLNADARLWLLAHDTPTNGILGMINCLRQEGGGDKIRCIFNPSLASNKIELLKKDPVKALKSIYGDILRKDLVTNVCRDGVWGTYRHLPLLNDKESAPIETDYSYINILNRGDLSSLRWVDSPMKFSNSKETPMVQVYYSALNFKDIMLATAKLGLDSIPEDMAIQDCILGHEYSGRDQNGRRVMGLQKAQGLATAVPFKPVYVWPVPDDWTLEEAATVPIVYATVYYAFFMRTTLRKGETVLIHAGSGGIGQSAIRVALSQGCEVFTTVSTQAKRDFLKNLFPQLKDRNFAYSRDCSFEHHILRETGGRGVDVVLNSLAEDQFMASVRLMAANGRFLEIGKVDFAKNTPLGTEIFLKNIAFHGVQLDVIINQGGYEMEILNAMILEGIKNGVVKPMCRTVYGKDEAEAAFRFMASGKHIGKVLIKIREEESAKVVVPRPLRQKAMPLTTFYQRKSYVVTGGLGGFGLALCEWLVQRGARNLVLTSRSGVSDGYQSRCIRIWKKLGVKVLICKNDVAEKDSAVKLLNAAATLGPVGGIFNLAMVLRDGFIENQTVENFVAVCNPKVTGTHRLDEASRKLCPELDHFVVFSSVSCGRGNAGQTNYGFANSVMERICELRKKDGLPGLAIQWGAIGDVGVILESMGGNDMVIGGTLPQRIVSCMTTMDRFLLQSHPVVSSYVLAEKQGGGKSRAGQKHNLIDIVANILGIKDVSSVSPKLTLADLGMDSLMGVEIKHALERNFNTVLSINDIRQLNMNILNEINSGEAESSEPAQALVKEKGDKAAEFIVERFDTKNMVAKECVVALNKVTKGTPLFIIHPIEGVTIALKHLASKIECPVYGIQCTANTPLDSMEELAAYYRLQIQNELPDGPYRIAGYSFGACVAFEMALQMQREDPGNPDVMEHLVLLDGSHSFLTYLLDYYLARFHHSEMGQSEADSLCVFMLHFMPIDYDKVKAELLEILSWAGKLNFVADMLMKTGKFSNQEDVAKAADIHHKELMMSHIYVNSGKFNGKVTLIRAAQNEALFNKLGHDYRLGEVCTSEVRVHAVEGDHDTFILGRYGDETAKVINNIFQQ